MVPEPPNSHNTYCRLLEAGNPEVHMRLTEKAGGLNPGSDATSAVPAFEKHGAPSRQDISNLDAIGLALVEIEESGFGLRLEAINDGTSKPARKASPG